MALAGGAGQVVEHDRYSVYGRVSVFNGSKQPIGVSGYGQALGFTGRRLDGESGLWEYRSPLRSRDYRPRSQQADTS